MGEPSTSVEFSKEPSRVVGLRIAKDPGRAVEGDQLGCGLALCSDHVLSPMVSGEGDLRLTPCDNGQSALLYSASGFSVPWLRRAKSSKTPAIICLYRGSCAS